MLVQAKLPHASLEINGYRIYGGAMIQGPTNIPYDMYQECTEILEEATYREDTLKELFGRSFPMIAFKYSEIKYLPDKTLDILIEYMNLQHCKVETRYDKVRAIQSTINDLITHKTRRTSKY